MRKFAIIALSAQIALSAPFAAMPVPITSVASVAATVGANGDIGMTASTFTAAQSAGSVIISVQRSGGKTGAVSVKYTTLAESAVPGQQYTTQTGTLSWANNDAAVKTFKVPLNTGEAFSGTKSFVVRLTAGSGTLLGAHSAATVDIVGDSDAPTAGQVRKSIKEWVSCSETIDESAQLASALQAAANNAFTLVVDCPVRLHTGTASESSIAVPDGVTVEFEGAGEFLAQSNGPPALTVENPSEVTFNNWNYTYL